MKTIALLIGFLSIQLSGFSQNGSSVYGSYQAPHDVPALEGDESYFDLPYIDTLYVHDTVYIADFDAFLKRYYQGKISVDDLVKNQALMDSVLKDLSALTGENLFYNFFEHNYWPRSLANNLVIKDFYLDKNLKLQRGFRSSNFALNPNLSHELLFRFDGTARTNRFLKNPDAVVNAISYLFTELQQDSTGIRSIDLYFPDYDFKEKRPMAQFLKSIHQVMIASKAFNSGSVKLKLFFTKPADSSIIGDDFIYSLHLKADEVILVDGTQAFDDYYVKGDFLTPQEITEISLLDRMKSHFYLARFSTGDSEFKGRNITVFTPKLIRSIVEGDIPDNNWESYLWFLIGLIAIIILITALYFIIPAFSYLLNQNIGIVLTSAVIMTIEIIMLTGMVFENMCYEDSSTSIGENPTLLFSMPILMVVVLPLIRQISKNRRLP